MQDEFNGDYLFRLLAHPGVDRGEKESSIWDDIAHAYFLGRNTEVCEEIDRLIQLRLMEEEKDSA